MDLREILFEKINNIWPGLIHLPDPRQRPCVVFPKEKKKNPDDDTSYFLDVLGLDCSAAIDCTTWPTSSRKREYVDL